MRSEINRLPMKHDPNDPNDLIPDPLFCSVIDLHVDVVRDQIRKGIIKPKQSPRGKDKTRLWDWHTCDFSSLIRPFMQAGLPSRMAGPIAASFAELTENLVDKIIAADAPWHVSFYEGGFVVLEAPHDVESIGWRRINGDRNGKIPRDEAGIPDWTGNILLLATYNDASQFIGFDALSDALAERTGEWAHVGQPLIDSIPVRPWRISVNATETIRRARARLKIKMNEHHSGNPAAAR